MFRVPFCRSISNKYWYFSVFIDIIFYLNPNIIGQTNSVYRHITSETSSSGALSAWNQNELKYPSAEDGGARKCWLKIDASASSSIYGDFSTVQPKAAYTLIIIKVWSAGGWTEVSFEYIELTRLASIFTTEAVSSETVLFPRSYCFPAAVA